MRHPFLAALVAIPFLMAQGAFATTVVINEFQSSNSETIADENGDFEDWIELYNHGETPVFLDGYGLSDNENNPFKWQLPDIVLEPGQFLLIFASNKDRLTGPFLHTNFAISAGGEELLLTALDGTMLDFVPPTPVPTDHSLGRQPDGTGEWFLFDQPTPGTGNSTNAYLGVLEPPTVSHESGFFPEAFTLTATHDDTAVSIRYSLDGSIPGLDAPAFPAGLLIEDRHGAGDVLALIPTSTPQHWSPPNIPPAPEAGPGFKGWPVRLRAHKEGWLPSPILTHTYFVTEEGRDRYPLPVISLVTEVENLFDPDIGIFVLGTNFDEENMRNANFQRSGRNWERPVHVWLGETDGASGFSQDMGVRIHGGTTRFHPQKSLRLYARTEYSGENAVAYPLIPGLQAPDGTPTTTFRRFLLRNSGNDFRGTMIRDLFMQSLMEMSERVETQAGRSSVVFVNGEFWGILNIRERHDPNYLAIRYDLDPDRITILQNDAVLGDGNPADRTAYLNMREYAVVNDLAIEQHYAHVTAQVDPESLIDHFIGNIYFHNTDWPHNNLRFWRYQRDEDDDAGGDWWRDGRWRWMTYDTDFGFGLAGPTRRQGVNDQYLDDFVAMYGPLTGPSANTLRWTTEELNGRILLTWPNELFRAMLDNEGFRTQFISRFADYLNSAFREEIVLQRLALATETVEPVMQGHINRWRNINGTINNWYTRIAVMNNFAEQRPAHVRQHIIDYFNLEGTYELTIAMPPEGSARVRVNSIELEANGEEWTGIYFLGVPLEVEVMPEFGHEFLGWDGAFEGEGALLALNPGSDVSLTPFVKEDNVSLHEVMLPRFIQGQSPTNNDRIPYTCRLRIEGLLPNALYRYANRVVTSDDSPTQNGAGNAIYYDLSMGTFFRTTDTPNFSDPSTHGEFITDGDGIYEGWFTLEPSGNQRFGEPELFIRVLLNDGMGGEEYRHFLTTVNTVRVLPFGLGWDDATGLYATSPMSAQNIVVLHDDIDGVGRPLAATLIEDTGFEVDNRYATYYEQFVTGQDGHFGALLPNELPGGLLRIEEFDRATASSIALYTQPDGFWPSNANTINPSGGLGFPFAITLGPATEPGDVNGDGEVNAIDVQLAINAALGIEIDPSFDADINDDGVVNAIDVQLVINAALGISINP